MKNIHMLPTDKPSRLVKIKDNLFYTTTKNIPGGVYQNIYITSNEEKFIKYEYVTDGIEVIKATPKLVNAQGLVDRRDWKKIILTTDPKLFNDGVQFIDDEFLEWFVKNPSCEEVKFELQIKSVQLPQEQLSENSYGLSFRWMDIPYYKIIIPKEQSCSCTDECLGYLTKTCKRLNKYEEEKLYSRKDVLNLLDFVNDRLPDLYSRFNPQEELEEWFNQFKQQNNEQ